jgi:hypothetical protein
LGPVTILARKTDEIKRYAEKHGIPNDKFFLTKRGIIEMVSAVSTLYYVRFGKTINGNDLFQERIEEQMEHEKDMYVFSNTEEGIIRHGYDVERIFIEQIRTGNVQEIEQQMQESDAMSKIGRLAKTPSKHFEYMICTSICLASRAAMDGGLDYADAYSMSDIFCKDWNCAKTFRK